MFLQMCSVGTRVEEEVQNVFEAAATHGGSVNARLFAASSFAASS